MGYHLLNAVQEFFRSDRLVVQVVDCGSAHGQPHDQIVEDQFVRGCCELAIQQDCLPQDGINLDQVILQLTCILQED